MASQPLPISAYMGRAQKLTVSKCAFDYSRFLHCSTECRLSSDASIPVAWQRHVWNIAFSIANVANVSLAEAAAR
jgi:hypothetical protein